VGSHAAALRRQGAEQELVDAIGTGDLSKVKLDPKDAALLKFVKLLTLEPAKTTDADVQAMRDAGWTDEQIWEASLEVSMFSLLNRMADAHGLDYPSTGWYPPALRDKLEKEKADESKSKQGEGK
jgi:alkylhydroperoxidase family enzyme